MNVILFKPNTPPTLLTEFPADRIDSEELVHGEVFWFDFNRPQARQWPQQVNQVISCEVDDSHMADSLNELHPSFFDDMDDYEMIIFEGLSNTAWKEIKTQPTTFFLFDHFLVTIHSPHNRAINVFRERLLSGSLTMQTNYTPEKIMHHILNLMVNQFLEMRDPLTEQIDIWRIKLLDKDFADWNSLMNHKRQLRRLEILCGQQVDALMLWREQTRIQFDEYSEVRYNDLTEHVNRVLQHVRSSQSEIEFLIQLHFSISAQQTNETVRLLTLVSLIFLPLTLISGIFGMNFEYIPLLKEASGFFLIMGGMVLTAVCLVILFKLKKWL